MLLAWHQQARRLHARFGLEYLDAGTADNSVAEECRVIADAMGCYCFRLSDVSVDGLHRVLQNIDAVRPPPPCGSPASAGAAARPCSESQSGPEQVV